MKKLKLKIFYFLFFSLSFLFLNLKPAQADINLGIFPAVLQIDSLPPAEIKTPIEIFNLGDETVDLDIVFKPFLPSSSENGQVKYSEDALNYYADPFIFDKIDLLDGSENIKTLTLAPGQKKKLNLSISIPRNELLGDYYFSIQFISKGIGISGSTLSQNSGGIATNILLSIGAKDSPKGFIEEFSSPFFLEKGPVRFKVRIRNSGNHYITPNGTITIKNMFGQTVGKVDLLPVNILSNSIRAIPDSLQSPDASDSAALEIKKLTDITKPAFSWWSEKFLLGFYTATLTVSLSENGPIFQKNVHFLAFPILTLTGIIAIIFMISFIIIRTRKNMP